jgi:hypothetical protein
VAPVLGASAAPEAAIGAAGLAAIDRPGTTQLRLALDPPAAGVVADRIRYRSGDAADPALRPELVVTFQP